jgi:hypothetical protein
MALAELIAFSKDPGELSTCATEPGFQVGARCSFKTRSRRTVTVERLPSSSNKRRQWRVQDSPGAVVAIPFNCASRLCMA